MLSDQTRRATLQAHAQAGWRGTSGPTRQDATKPHHPPPHSHLYESAHTRALEHAIIYDNYECGGPCMHARKARALERKTGGSVILSPGEGGGWGGVKPHDETHNPHQTRRMLRRTAHPSSEWGCKGARTIAARTHGACDIRGRTVRKSQTCRAVCSKRLTAATKKRRGSF